MTLVTPVTLLTTAGLPAFALGGASEDLVGLSLEELGNVRVTTVTREPRGLLDSAASVFVISREAILRSGATSLAEALRLAPNLQVARINASEYAISSRGFNNAIGNKLLVLVDGRTVYTPLFSGVSWDVVDVLLEDVDRIEVVSGPGSALWGTNAVNGVINILTRPAGETRGTFAGALWGESALGLAFRHGGSVGKRGTYRVYAKGDRNEASADANGDRLTDEWDRVQVGWRADWDVGSSALTFQGDAYRAESDSGRILGAVEASGANAVGRWERTLANGSRLMIQSYFDYSERENRLIFGDRLGIFDAEVQHDFASGRHDVVWGAGYRVSSDDTTPGLLAAFRPADRTLDWWSLYAQDEIRLGSAWGLLGAVRVENNDYSGTELLPSLRATWKPRPDRLVWGAISRTVRAPSRIDREFRLPGTEPFLIVGGPNFDSEIADVFELGTRGRVGSRATYSLTLFRHDWDRLRSGQPVANGFEVQNGLAGTTSGVEGWFTLDVGERVRITGGATYLDEDIHRKRGSLDPTGPSALGNDPDVQAQLGLALELGNRLDGDLRARYVGELPDPEIPDYTPVDFRLSWTPSDQLALAVIVENVLDDEHAEFQPGALAAQSVFGRSFSVRLRWQR